MNKQIACTALTAASLMLSGCGSFHTYREAKHYHEDLDRQASSVLSSCRAGERTSMTQNRPGAAPDCFDLVVKQSPKRIGVRADTPDLRDGDRLLPPASEDAYAYIDQFALMALFSKMVYHRFQDEQLRSSKAACHDDAGRHPLLKLYDARSTNGRWRLWEDGKEGCHAEGGLFMETYVYYPPNVGTQGNGFTRAVIVFRGTENGQTQRMADWSANLSAALGFTPVQYKTASEQVDKIVASLHARHGGYLPIYAAGHSLGGGLAQMAAYSNHAIHAAYAFNSTPVTGWSWIHKLRRESGKLPLMNGDPTIYRISQRSEVLQALRAVSTAVNSERFGRSDFDFDFRITDTPKGASRRDRLKAATDQHDIGLLACHMAARVVLGHAGRDDRAAFDYTSDMALNALWQKDRLEADSNGDHSLCSQANVDIVRDALCENGVSSPVCHAAPQPDNPAIEVAQQAGALP